MSVWNEIDSFTQAYVDAMLWASCDDDDVPLDKNYSIDDIAESAMIKIVADCKKFQEENASDIATIPYRRTNDGNWSGKEQCGHDLFLTRNRHGVGFQDRDYIDEDVRDRLHTNAQAYGEVDCYVGDNGMIYI
jgi:hypothetical protein